MFLKFSVSVQLYGLRINSQAQASTLPNAPITSHQPTLRLKMKPVFLAGAPPKVTQIEAFIAVDDVGEPWTEIVLVYLGKVLHKIYNAHQCILP